MGPVSLLGVRRSGQSRRSARKGNSPEAGPVDPVQPFSLEMNNDLLFVISDPENHYTIDQIASILQKAREQGHPMCRGSYLEGMTVKQIDALVNGRTDA